MPRLSIVIPWSDGTVTFEDTLVSVLQNRPAHCEILVVHSGPYDDPYELAGEVRFLHAPHSSEVMLLNAGLEAVSGEIVHVLRCGVEVQEGWAEPALRCFRDPAVASVAPLIVEREDPRRLAAVGVTYDSGSRRLCGAGSRLERWSDGCDSILSPLLAAGFYRRTLVQAVGGFEPAVGTRYADVDLGLTLAKLGFRCAVADQSVVLAKRERVDHSFRTGQQAERLFWRHAPAGAGTWLRHALAVAAGCCTRWPTLGSAGELAGRLWGCRERRRHQDYRAQLQSLADSAVLAPLPPVSPPTVRKAA